MHFSSFPVERTSSILYYLLFPFKQHHDEHQPHPHHKPHESPHRHHRRFTTTRSTHSPPTYRPHYHDHPLSSLSLSTTKYHNHHLNPPPPYLGEMNQRVELCPIRLEQLVDTEGNAAGERERTYTCIFTSNEGGEKKEGKGGAQRQRPEGRKDEYGQKKRRRVYIYRNVHI